MERVKIEEQNEKLNNALHLAAEGFKVFPLIPDQKTPMKKGWQKLATNDPEEVEKLFRWGDMNIGLKTGDGLLVIDLDVKGGNDGIKTLEDWEILNGRLPPTRTSRTASGGLHLLYRVAKEIKNKSGVYPGVDIRGDGGYIVAPGSLINGKAYEWVVTLDIADADDLVTAFIEGKSPGQRFILPTVIPMGERNDLLFRYGSSLQARGRTDDEIREELRKANDERCEDPLEDKELEVIINQVLKYDKGSTSQDSESMLPIFEAEGRYYKYGPKGATIEISNFIIIPQRFIEVIDNPGLDELDADIQIVGGKKFKRSYRTSDFDDINRFLQATNSLEARFTGNKTDLQYIKTIISEKVETRITGYAVGGLQRIDKRWYFVTSDGALNSENRIREDYVHVCTNGIQTDLLSYEPISREELKDIAGSLLSFNSPGIAAGLMGYFGALFFKERLWADYKIKFSHLIVSGEAGSGKSQTLENIIIPLLGIVSGTHSASGVTKFVMDKNVSSHNTLSYILDEYKPEMLAPHIMNAISNIARVSYDRLKSSRGTRNQELEDLFLTAPLCMFGEASTSETAVIERSLLLTFSKKESRIHKKDFEVLKHSKKLSKLGRSLLNKALSLEDKSIETILTKVDQYLKANCSIKDERVVNTLRIVYFGLTILKIIFNDLELNFEEETGYQLVDLFDTLQNSVIDENLGGGDSTKSSVDITLELMSQALKSRNWFNQEYIVHRASKASRIIGLRIPELHAVMTKYIKEYNIQERFLNPYDFKKQIAKSNYVVELSKKWNVTIQGKSTSRSFLTIDLDKAELEGLEIDGFEHLLNICEEFGPQ
jgi:hypothetical protein